MDWLHFVGKGYYTQKNFIREAQRSGVSRRISARLAGGLHWGDRVFLAQGDQRKKNRVTPFNGSEVFAYFTVERLAWSPPGIYPEILEGLIEMVDEAVGVVERGCGKYVLGPSYRTDLPVHRVLELLRDSDALTEVFLQGPLTVLPVPVLLPDYGQRWGFQRIDGEAVMSALDEEMKKNKRRKTPRPATLEGVHAVDWFEVLDAQGGLVAEMTDYVAGDLWGKASVDDPDA